MANVKKITLDWSETGKTVYAIIRREADSYRLNDADGTFASAPADPYLSLAEDSVIKGRYEASESRAAWNDGRYTIAVYKQAGGSPAPASDTIIGTGEMDIINDAEIYPDVLVSSRSTYAGGAVASVTGAVGSVTAAVTVGTNNDKTGYALTQSFPTNFSALSITAGGLVDITQAAADKAWSTASRLLTAGTNIVLAKGTGITGFTDVTAAQVSTQVWSEPIPGTFGSGTAGYKLNSAASAGDPWGTALPGSYGAGTAGKIVGDNINATISSRSTLAATDVWAAGTRTLTDKTGFELSAAGVDAILDEVVEGTYTLRQLTRLLASALFAKTSGGGTATLIARDIGDTKARITLTVDSNGNRTAVTLDGA